MNLRKQKLLWSLLLVCPTVAFAPRSSLLPAARGRIQEVAPRSLARDSHKSQARRDILSVAKAFVILTLTNPKEVKAACSQYDPNNKFCLQVTAMLPKGFQPQSTARLIVTVKPAVTYTSQVPQSVAEQSLRKTGHWVPVVLRSSQRWSDLQVNDKGLVTTTLTLEHIPPEAGRDVGWWSRLPLIITAKLDVDGKGTLGPLDLTGCRILPNRAGVANTDVCLPLQKRGLYSDFILRR